MTLAIAGFARFPPELLVVLVASLLLWHPVHRLLLRLTVWCFEWGAFRVALALTRVLECLPLAAWMRSFLWREELYAYSALGHTERAVAGARRLAVHAKADSCLSCANCAINIFINAGLYLVDGHQEARIPGHGSPGVA